MRRLSLIQEIDAFYKSFPRQEATSPSSVMPAAPHVRGIGRGEGASFMTIRSLYRGDCLTILDDYIPPESVDLVYLDPPFNSKSIYNLPFKSREKTHKPVQAFTDTWTWQDMPDETGLSDNDRLAELRNDLRLRDLAFLVDYARKQDTPNNSMGSYILSMTYRLQAIHKALKPTGSVYLHCDPTANYFLRMAMECIFGRQNFKNEIVWHYPSMSRAQNWFPKKHDIILFYSKGATYTFNTDDEYVREKYAKTTISRSKYGGAGFTRSDGESNYLKSNTKLCDTVWNIPHVKSKNEALGYPTQKPLALLNRIISASSNHNDLILDPFCGCGTAVHAAESLERQWIGIDISRFSVRLINERILSNFGGVFSPSDVIEIYGQPETINEARRLAQSYPFEFEKWACGKIGANGMAARVGQRGADGGIDGIIEFWAVRNGKPEKHTAIVQVKGGNVTADSVRALDTVVRRSGSMAGIMVCFANQMGTVNNQSGTEVWTDDYRTYPVIQGLSVEDLITGQRPNMPPLYGERRGGQISMF